MTGPVLIQGEVVDAAGQPVALARVAVEDGPGPIQDIGLLTGADGHFTLAVPGAGVYTVGVHADAYVPVRTTVTAGMAPGARLRLVVKPEQP